MNSSRQLSYDRAQIRRFGALPSETIAQHGPTEPRSKRASTASTDLSRNRQGDAP